MINMLIGPAIELAGGWFKSKAAQKAAETEAKVAMKKAEAKVYETEATSTMLMEQQLTRQMESSWKDEFWVIIFGSILVACFLPWTQEYVKNGFIFLDEHTPPWFANCLYISISASFGYRIGKAGLGALANRKPK
jgi:hypothetical protein|tara:strand:+ start:109 stop:513 length:405 start_codon:yes stop_codon:yes gene_type:complete